MRLAEPRLGAACLHAPYAPKGARAQRRANAAKILTSQGEGRRRSIPAIKPSEDDLTAAPVTVQTLKQSGVPFVFVLTRMKPGTLITAQAAAILSKHGQVAETFVADRTGYKSPYAKGQTITEAEPKGPAAQEIAALCVCMKAYQSRRR